MRNLMIVIASVVMVAGMIYGFHVKHDTYALINVDAMGNEYIIDQYLSWDDCMSQSHTECRPMGEIE